MAIFNGTSDGSRVDESIVDGLKKMLDENNEIVKVFEQQETDLEILITFHFILG